MRLAAPLVLLVVAACGIPRMPDDLASRCQVGLDLFERSRCQPGQQSGVPLEYARAELASMGQTCHDAASVARIRALTSTCFPRFAAAEADRKEDRRKIRARYVMEVSALLVDPLYGPAADRYRDAEDRSSREREEAHAVLVELARKHGIDPAYAKELELW